MSSRKVSNENVFDPRDASGEGDDEYADEEFDEDTDQELDLSVLEKLSQVTKCESQNKTFSSYQIREIERDNAILMNKIWQSSCRKSQYKPKVVPQNFRKASSYTINKNKAQMKIDWENQILLKKIQAVKPAVKFNKF